ncbi:protein fem-1 homolog A-like [Palaemon carinicauda]|uniref:protein fem-1 homolog A-like n=1 Tax=Palaemon carinicauda TaxID=392227 RepID=UPI0035B669B7
MASVLSTFTLKPSLYKVSCHSTTLLCNSSLFHKDNHSQASFCTRNSMNECHGPLVMASTYGHVDCTRYLVEVLNADIEEHGMGANVNTIHELSSTPVNAACQLGCTAITKLLVEHGADIEITDRLRGTCMMAAGIRGHIQVVKYLISIGADVNKKNHDRKTTLYKCAELGHLELVKMLLDNHANMDADSSGITPLLAAASGGQIQVVEYLFGQMALTAKDRINVYQVLGAALFDKNRDIDSAMKYWRLAMCERRNRSSYLPSKRNEFFLLSTCHTYEERSTYGNVFNILLTKAKSVLSADEVQLGNSRVQELARLKPRDIKGRTLLHMACSKCFRLGGLFFEVDGFPNLDVVNFLIENGADSNVKDHGGNTPLHSLAKSGKSSKETIDTLLSAGTHFDTLNGKGKSFASIMADFGQDITQHVDPMLHISLQCMAANCVRKHRIPYKDSLSPVLSQFVDIH